MGKDSGKEWTCIYADLIQFAIHMRLTQNYKSVPCEQKLKNKVHSNNYN